MKTEFKDTKFSKNRLYIITVLDKLETILKDLAVISENNEFLDIPSEYLINSEDEKRAYLKGTFLMTGSINDPKKSRYHLEFMLDELNYSNFISKLLNDFNLNSKVLKRDNRYMVYIKEAEKIGDFLRIIEAMNALFYFEDIRIYRDHKNMTNRLNNCEQANVDKIIETASKQVKDIELIENIGGMDLLDDKTKIAAIYRLKYKEASLTELSEIISIETNNNITKSGLHHRFTKIKEIANKIRETKR